MGEEDSKTRNAETTEMLNYAFSTYELETLLNTESSLGKVNIDKTLDDTITLLPKENVTALNKKGQKKKNLTYKVDVDTLKAPLKKGDVVGKLKIHEDGKLIRTVDVTINKDVVSANYIELYYIYLRNILTGKI